MNESVRNLQKVATGNKVAFIPGPNVQAQLEQMASDAANQQQAAQAQQQMSQQTQAQAQGAPPTMRIEDLAQMLDQMNQGLQQALQQVAQQVQQAVQTIQTMQTAGSGEKKKLSPDERMTKIEQQLQHISQAIGVAGAGGTPAPAGMPPAPQGAPGSANDPAAQQATQGGEQAAPQQ